MPNAMDLIRVVPGARNHLKRVWKRVSFHDERVIAHNLHWRRQTGEHPVPVVLHLGSLPVHDAFGADDASPICLANRLVTKADAEGGNAAPPTPNGLDGYSRLRRSARAGRENDRRR